MHHIVGAKRETYLVTEDPSLQLRSRNGRYLPLNGRGTRPPLDGMGYWPRNRIGSSSSTGAAIRNLEFACSRWSTGTYSFAWSWGESGLSLEDAFILTRLSLRGANILDLAKLSREDRDDVESLIKLHKQARNRPIFTAQGVRKAAAANAKKTSLGSWLRYFFKDFQPARTVAPRDARDFVAGPQYKQQLYMAGFFSYFLSYYVLPDYPIDGLSQAVFPLAVLLARGQPVALAPLFLGSLFRQLDLVQADYARSLGVRAAIPREQWQGTSSDASWYEACDIEANFTPRPYSIPSPGVMGVGLSLLPLATSLNAASSGNHVARTVCNATLIALPGWLPFLNSETTGVVAYCPDRFARQLGFDQGVPGPVPPMPSFAESQLRFMATQLSPIQARLGRGSRGLAIRMRDTSLRAITGGVSWDASPATPSCPEAHKHAGGLRDDTTFASSGAISTFLFSGAYGEGGPSPKAHLNAAGVGRYHLRGFRARGGRRDGGSGTSRGRSGGRGGAEADVPDTRPKRRRLDTVIESDDEEDENMGADGGDDDEDRLPLSVHLRPCKPGRPYPPKALPRKTSP
ncbi:hypothetical protein C3L33_08986, partial [Rhododendron williamsianum]